jgi:PAS domain S-box-containing protein
MSSHQSKINKNTWPAWVLLSIGLIVTTAAAVFLKSEVESDVDREFAFSCNQIQDAIHARMKAHAQILMGGAALFDSSEEVTRKEWHTFTMHQQIDRYLPGIQGIGFSRVIPRKELAQHIQEIRDQGFSDYQVWPEGDREIYTSIIYLEPFSGRNLRAFGYDMLSEPVRRKAMEQARDMDTVTLTEKVILVQETDRDVQAGTLMYVPVYQRDMGIDTIEQRRAALKGWVYSPYRMKDLMQGICKAWDLESGKQIRLQIFDNALLSPESLLYDSQPKEGVQSNHSKRWTRQTVLPLYDHQWYLQFTRMNEQVNYGIVYAVFFGGIIIGLLLFSLVISLLNTQYSAERLVVLLTKNLMESEEKYRVIFNNTLYAVYIFDLETFRLLDVNDTCTRTYGYSREELLSGMTIHDMMVEGKESDASIMHADHAGTVIIPLRYHRKKDGTIFPVEIVGGPFVWKGQHVMFGLAHDITDRKLAEENLIQAHAELDVRVKERTSDLFEANTALTSEIEERERIENMLREERWRLQSIIEGTRGGTWEWNVQTGALVVNEMWVQTLGYTLDELTPFAFDTWETLVHPDDLNQSKALLERHFADELLHYTCEFRMKHKKGHWIWIQDSGRLITRTTDGKPLMMFGAHTEITERKRAEELLRASEERYRILTENSLQGIAILKGVPPVISYVNPKWTEIFGYTADEVRSIDSEIIWNLVHPEDRSMVRQRIVDRLMGELVIASYEFRIIRKDGATRWVEVFASKIPSDNDISMSQSTYIDITERKQSEIARLDLELKLRQVQKVESLSRMAGAIAHHFNNLLYVVMGNLEMAMDGLPHDSNTIRYMTESMNATGKLAQISSMMLIYLGQTLGKQEPLDLSETCRQSLPLLEASIPKGIIFKTDLPSTGPFIRSNDSQIQKILTNLIANAWEAVGENPGTIELTVNTVALENVPAVKRFPVDWQPKESFYACLEVTDTGCGIATEDIEKLFDPFFTTKFTGRGLGLPVVIGIVGTHGGGITVESHLDLGSAFRVFLPVSDEAAPIPVKNVEKTTAIQENGMILVVEDEPQVRIMARIMLTRLGYPVLEAADGVEAVEIFQERRNDIRCILSDLTMPRMDGWETLSAIRKISPGIPVILSSGYDEAQVMAGEHYERPDAFLGKPYQLKGLRETIRRVLANSQ